MTRKLLVFVIVGILTEPILCSAGLRGHPPAVVQLVQFDSSVSTPGLTCSSDRPIVFEGESVALRAWDTNPSNQSANYKWSVDAGRIVGKGREVRWDLAGIASRPIPVTATLTVDSAKNDSSGCAIEIIVAPVERGDTRETGRAFLLRGQNEAAGFGLYSYLLLGAPPIASTRERYTKCVESYLASIENVIELQSYFPKSKLNIAYLPLQTSPPAKPSADWFLEHYDYARARALLDLLPGSRRDGPYIVSVLHPLSSGRGVDQYLFQDLSSVPPRGDLVSWWVREFLNQAAQEHFWEPRTAQQFALKMRTTISALAVGLPDVKKSLDGWVAWIHS